MGRDAGFGEGDVVPLRFERGLREPKTLVLPLHHGTSAIIRAYCSDLRCKGMYFFYNHQMFLQKNATFFFKRQFSVCSRAKRL